MGPSILRIVKGNGELTPELPRKLGCPQAPSAARDQYLALLLLGPNSLSRVLLHSPELLFLSQSEVTLPEILTGPERRNPLVRTHFPYP